MFETTGQVELAEILFEGTRSKGCGVVQFSQVQEAETAIGKPLKISSLNFNHSSFATIRSQISAVYVWWPTFGCALQRPLAHVHTYSCQGRPGYAYASRWLRNMALCFLRLLIFLQKTA